MQEPKTQPRQAVKNKVTVLLIGGAGLLLALFLPIATLSSGIFTKTIMAHQTDLALQAIPGVIALVFALVKMQSAATEYVSMFSGMVGVFTLPLVGWVTLKIAGAGSDGVDVALGMAIPVSLIAAIMIIIGGFTKNPK